MKRIQHGKHMRPHYTHMDVLMASPTHPLPEATRLHWMTRTHLALSALETADAPTPEDWRVLSDAVNLVDTMLRHGIATDESGIKGQCIEEMAHAGARYMQGQTLRLSGAGIKAMRAMLEDLDAIMREIPHREMVRIHIATEKRMMQIVRGKVKPGDVVMAL